MLWLNFGVLTAENLSNFTQDFINKTGREPTQEDLIKLGVGSTIHAVAVTLVLYILFIIFKKAKLKFLERERQQKKYQQEQQEKKQREYDDQDCRSSHHTHDNNEYWSDIKTNWYTILGVSISANAKKIKHAYRKRISEYHPDKVAQLGEKLKELAVEESKKINAAYEYAISRSSCHD